MEDAKHIDSSQEAHVGKQKETWARFLAAIHINPAQRDICGQANGDMGSIPSGYTHRLITRDTYGQANVDGVWISSGHVCRLITRDICGEASGDVGLIPSSLAH